MLDEQTKIRTSAQREVIINELRAAGSKGVTNARLKEISNNYTSRTAELTKSGYDIEARNLGDGLFLYVLIHEPKELTTQQRALDMFWDIFENEYGGIADREVLEELFNKHRLNVVRNWGANKKKTS